MKVRTMTRKLKGGRVLMISIGSPESGDQEIAHNDSLSVGSTRGLHVTSRPMDKEYRGLSAEVLLDMGLPDDPTAGTFPDGIGPGRHFDLETEKLLDAFYEIRTAVLKGDAPLEDLERAAVACGPSIEVRDIVMTEYRVAMRHLKERADSDPTLTAAPK